MMGISFSGGLSLVAAGRPSLKDHVELRVFVRRARRPAAGAALPVHGHRADASRKDPAKAGRHDCLALNGRRTKVASGFSRTNRLSGRRTTTAWP